MRKLTANVDDEAEMTVSLSALRKFVNNRPSVDAEPVRHGKCELCGRVKPIKAITIFPESGLEYASSIMARYCPNCGARKDG